MNVEFFVSDSSKASEGFLWGFCAIYNLFKITIIERRLNKMLKIFAFCKKYILQYKLTLLLYVIISIFISLASIFSPYILGDFIDQLMQADDISIIYRYFILFASINIFTIVFGYISGRIYVRLQMQLGFKLNKAMIQKYQQSPLSYVQKQDAVYMNQRVNNDSNTLIIFCISIIQSILMNSTIIIVTVILITLFHPILAGILAVVSVVYIIFYALYRKRLYQANFSYRESQAHFFAKLNEQMFNIRFIKLHSLFSKFINRLNHGFDELLTSSLRYQHTNYVFSSLDKVVYMVAQMVLLLFGGIEIINGRLTIGRYIIIASYFNMLLGAIRYFFGLGKTVQDNLVSYERLQELETLTPEPNGTEILSSIERIQFKNVSFSYGDRPIICNKSLVFEQDNIYMIVGSNGAGKSTFLDILTGLQVGQYTGEIFYNNIEMGNLNMYALRDTFIGMSEQEPVLIADTLRYNILFGGGELQEGHKLIDILGLRTFVAELPNGFDTVVNEGSSNLSGGEKQKISLLRTLLKSPNVIILDEPTSALDTVSSSNLKSYLHSIKNNKIIIIITHDPDFIDDNDIVVELKK